MLPRLTKSPRPPNTVVDEQEPFTRSPTSLRQNENNSLPSRIFGDITAAAIAACTVSPIVTIIDRATSEQVAQHKPLIQSLHRHIRCATAHPRKFFFSTPVGTMSALYAGTYAMSNASDTIGNQLCLSPVPLGIFKSVLTVAVNVSLGIWKDVLFARLAVQRTGGGPDIVRELADTHPVAQTSHAIATVERNANMPTRPVPKSVFAVFLLQDAINISSSFTLVDWVSDRLASGTGHASLIAQLSIPAVSQIFATPVHLLALDLYSKPGALNLTSRTRRQAGNVLPVTLLRSIRIVPALGIGIYLNKQLRVMFTENS